VPRESDIARNLQVQEEADRLEKDRVKKLTLEINERQEEEDLNEALAAVSCDICFIGGQWWFAESKLQLMWECGYRWEENVREKVIRRGASNPDFPGLWRVRVFCLFLRL
jgi:hypothetical protein